MSNRRGHVLGRAGVITGQRDRGVGWLCGQGLELPAFMFSLGCPFAGLCVRASRAGRNSADSGLLLGAAGVRAAGGSAAGDGGARDGGDEGHERRGRGRGFTARRGR